MQIEYFGREQKVSSETATKSFQFHPRRPKKQNKKLHNPIKNYAINLVS